MVCSRIVALKSGHFVPQGQQEGWQLFVGFDRRDSHIQALPISPEQIQA
jgi:hypothetical protein